MLAPTPASPGPVASPVAPTDHLASPLRQVEESQESCQSFLSDSSKETTPRKVSCPRVGSPTSAAGRQPVSPSTGASNSGLNSLAEREDALAALGYQADDAEPDRRKRELELEDQAARWLKSRRHPTGCAECMAPLGEGDAHAMPGCGHLVLCRACSKLLSLLGAGPSTHQRCKFCTPLDTGK